MTDLSHRNEHHFYHTSRRPSGISAAQIAALSSLNADQRNTYELEHELELTFGDGPEAYANYRAVVDRIRENPYTTSQYNDRLEQEIARRSDAAFTAFLMLDDETQVEEDLYADFTEPTYRDEQYH
jgi:hypothetical protein